MFTGNWAAAIENREGAAWLRWINEVERRKSETKAEEKTSEGRVDGEQNDSAIRI